MRWPTARISRRQQLVDPEKEAPNCPHAVGCRNRGYWQLICENYERGEHLYFVHKEFCFILFDSLRVLEDDSTERQA
jgi:hypothetical protein